MSLAIAGAVEVAAILLLTVGGIALPLICPAMGLVLVWLSTRWTMREMLLATEIVLVVFVLPIVRLLSLGANVDTSG